MHFNGIARLGARRLSAAALLIFCFGMIAALGSGASSAQASEAAWAALRQPGHLALMRHALAPGTGDPANFRIEDCATQRNLSEVGREQARRTGAAFRDNGIPEPAIYSSQWCRCLETARLLGLGTVTPLPSLNSFFGKSGEGATQTRQLQADIAAMDASRPAILVTHQVNITALTGVFPASGEIVVVRRADGEKLEVVGRLRLERD